MSDCIGTPGVPWNEADKRRWFEQRVVQRSYRDEVLSPFHALDTSDGHTSIVTYGALPVDRDRYPLLAVTMCSDDPSAPWVLITGGVHGYETSGVQGALSFALHHADDYRSRANIVIAPCVSPWGYEVIHRWNPDAVDPNRSFAPDSTSAEATGLMTFVSGLDVEFLLHIDLHETTDTDETEFRPALAARDGVQLEPGLIPDGFYGVGDSDNPQPDLQAAIIEAVEHVTHIAAADAAGQIIGTDLAQHGVINYPVKQLGLCAGMTTARFTSTTEVYPDSPKASAEICIAAQVAAVRGALDFALNSLRSSR